ncbi:MAG: AraC family transcriptional regulator [Candidatus Merdisoma sp.]
MPEWYGCTISCISVSWIILLQYFCRVFRKHTGLSPNQYRRHSRQLRIPSSAPAASAGNKQPGGTDLRSKN